MKIYILFLSCFVLLSSSLIAVQYGQLKVSSPPGQDNEATLELYEGDTCELLLIDAYNAYLRYTTEIDEEDVDFLITQVTENSYSIKLTQVIVGPLTLKLQTWGISTYNGHDPNYRRNATLHYKLTRASEVEYRNMNIISIPEDTVGDGKQVVVESSSDLQTWTPVHSSSVSGDKAFFRTRIVNSGE